jgi:hypothetical protein
MEDSTSPPGDCFHWKALNRFSGIGDNTHPLLNRRSLYTNMVFEPSRSAIDSFLNEYMLHVLTADIFESDFGVIQFFAELDETLAMFSKKFIQEFTYGSFEWGIKPFLSDLKALYETLQHLSAKSQALSLACPIGRKRVVADHRRIGSGYNDGNYLYEHEFVGYFRCKGQRRVTMPDYNSILATLAKILDPIGFHPDLATIWDLIPLSFVVDYVIPVGDLLESLHPRGWQRNMLLFDGWMSLSGQLTVKHCSYWGGINYADPTAKTDHNLYVRRKLVNFSLLKDQTDLDWKCPNLRQLFNVTYLTDIPQTLGKSLYDDLRKFSRK